VTWVGDQAAFTLSVIAYRAGVTSFELPILNDTHIIALSDQVELFSINHSATTDADVELLANCSSGDLGRVSRRSRCRWTSTETGSGRPPSAWPRPRSRQIG
jgi:hypothetical protein